MRVLPGFVAAVALAGAGMTAWASLAFEDPPAHQAYLPLLAADSAPSPTATSLVPTATVTVTPSATPTVTMVPSATPTSTAAATVTSAPTATPTRTPVPPQYLTITVSQGVQSAAVTAELALTPQQWQQGLMGRTSLPDDQGMLFVFPPQSSGPFYMVGTPIPLDIAFINPAGQVFDILHGQPYDPTLLVPSGPYHYVLEVAGGWFERMGMGIGAQLTGLEELP